jgi:hypothetical protein
MNAKHEVYPFAGALCVTTGKLLTAVHRAAGPPPSADGGELLDSDRRLRTAAGVAYGAAAACSALSARLLLVEREALRERVAEIDAPRSLELGVTALDATETASWRSTVRAAAAAAAELSRCADLWSVQNAAEGVQDLIFQLAAYVDELVAVLERIEPAEPSAEPAV